MKICIHWFRRDLRYQDNHALYQSLKAGYKVLPIFIIDTDIVGGLKKEDARLSFIYQQLEALHAHFKSFGSGLKVYKGKVEEVFEQILAEYEVAKVFCNRDYEPYARNRDAKVAALLAKHDATLLSYKDQVIFEADEVLKDNKQPYTVYTPYKNKWLARFDRQKDLPHYASEQHLDALLPINIELPTLEALGFTPSAIKVRPLQLNYLKSYEQIRDFPALDQTSYASVYLRFGVFSVRYFVALALEHNEVYLSELIWRSFFMQILYHFPHVVNDNFKSAYDHIVWRNNEQDLERWKNGQTGYPLVDAGMRQLNATGYMHNRVRMLVASFLCKHLLVQWQYGETYFAEKLLDYDLAANNGNWQWAAGTGCDAMPYFRIFNPITQLKKFDKDLVYTNKWVPELNGFTYPAPMVEHKAARERCLAVYKKGLGR